MLRLISLCIAPFSNLISFDSRSISVIHGFTKATESAKNKARKCQVILSPNEIKNTRALRRMLDYGSECDIKNARGMRMIWIDNWEVFICSVGWQKGLKRQLRFLDDFEVLWDDYCCSGQSNFSLECFMQRISKFFDFIQIKLLWNATQLIELDVLRSG